MKPTTLIYLLSLIILAFVAKGIYTVRTIQELLPDDLANQKLENLESFLYLCGSLVIVIASPIFKRKSNKNNIIKLKEIKKRAIKEKQGI
jgi:amino acid transporter